MRQKDFVTFEIAKKLKNKGFREKCMRHYYPKSKDLFLSYALDCENFGSYIDAPTISQVLEWLRKEKNIYIALDFFRFNGNTDIWWTYTIRHIEDDSTENIVESCKRKSWEQAALAGIEYVLNNNLI